MVEPSVTFVGNALSATSDVSGAVATQIYGVRNSGLYENNISVLSTLKLSLLKGIG